MAKKEENTIKQLTYWRDKFDEWLRQPENVREFSTEVHGDHALGYHSMYGTIKFAANWQE